MLTDAGATSDQTGDHSIHIAPGARFVLGFLCPPRCALPLRHGDARSRLLSLTS